MDQGPISPGVEEVAAPAPGGAPGPASWGRLLLLVLAGPRRHKRLALVSFAAVVGLALAGLAVVPRRYQVEAVLLVQRSSLLESLANPNLDRVADAPTRAAREVVLRREQLLELCRRPGFLDRHLAARAPVQRLRDWLAAAWAGRPPTEGERVEALADELERRLWVVTDHRTVSISVEWGDPELAFEVVDDALERYLSARRAAEVTVISDTVEVLQAHAARIEAELSERAPKVLELERQLQLDARRVPRELLAPPGREGELARAEWALAVRRRAVSDLEELRQRRLSELRVDLLQRLTHFAPQHPAIEATRQNIDLLSAPLPQLDALRGEVRDLERDLRRRGGLAERAGDPEAARRAEQADAQLRGLEGNPRLATQLEQLHALSRQYYSLTNRLDSARMELEGARLAFKRRYTVVTPPEVPDRPLRPSPRLVLLGALLGGVAQALFACAAVEIRAGRWASAPSEGRSPAFAGPGQGQAPM